MLWLLELLKSAPALITGGFGYLNKRADVDLQKFQTGVDGDVKINVEGLRTYVEAQKLVSASREKDRDHWATLWMVPTAFGVFLLHATAVVFDTLPLFGHVIGSWHIPKLPTPYDAMQSAIIYSVCGIATVGPVLNTVKKIFTR